MARVSVIIPVYNIEPHLRQCMDSVVGQTLKNLEIICVDDGSTDESPRILAEYAARDSRVRVITQENGGPGAARNAGLAQAGGEYLIFLDSDDWFEPDFLEKMAARAVETGADVTVCRAVEFDTHTGRELPSEWMLKTQYLPGNLFSPTDAAAHIFQFTYGWPWDKLYRTEFVRSAGLRYPEFPNSEDLVFVFQSLALADQLAVITEVLVHHRVNRSKSVSNCRYMAPEVPNQALGLLRSGLEKQGLYQRFEQSFLNWAMEFLVWNAANMGEAGAQQTYFRRLKKEWLPAMGFEAHPRNYYENRFTYCKYLLARYAPRPVFFSALAGYKWVKERFRRGGV